jgi:hypothetical protein
MTDSQKISVRVDGELAVLIETVAVQERRTISNVVRNALLDWAAQHQSHAGDRTARA